MTPTQLVKAFGSKRQAAWRLGVSRQTIYNWISSGKIPEDWVAIAKEVLEFGGLGKREKNVHSELRQARLMSAKTLGRHTKEQWDALVEFCGNKCVRCKDDPKKVYKDHIVPLYQGGSDSIENLQPLCRFCNSSKGAENVDYRPNGWEEAVKTKTD